MNIGFLGLGKLGLPVALAVESKGHTVVGFDISETTCDNISNRRIPYREIYAQEYLNTSRIKVVDMANLVKSSRIIFVPIQTPHDSKYEGITRLPKSRVDFNYTYLKQGISDLSAEIEKQGEEKIVVIISTVLPGTVRKDILPLLGTHTRICYNPYFIAMGTVIADFLNPEFVLFGVHEQKVADEVEEFYKTIHSAPFYRTTIENAELIKVLYNTFISTKIAFANTAMEMCHKLPGADVDAVIGGLKLATDRVISDKYLEGGMGDGGACHPRDNIALSWLSRRLDLSIDFFDAIMRQRENHTEWLASLIENKHLETGLPIMILGKSFKPETNITIGSPAILLANMLIEKNIDFTQYDPHVDDGESPGLSSPMIFFIATKHSEFSEIQFPAGSVIIDPWRYIEPSEGSELISVGRYSND